MKKGILVLGIAAAALAVSCNKDEIKVKGDGALTGNKAYLVVNIHDAGAIATTRADKGNPEFEYGTEVEYGVNDAHFYFYDDNGVFVSEAEVWDGGTPSESADGQKDVNIEFKSNTVIVLNNLTGKTYPNRVVTVLNKPEKFEAPEFLKDFPATLADANAEGITRTVSGDTYFTMSTTSYYTSDKLDDEYYFATPVETENFSLEPIADNLSTITPVKIYVERLAVKVEVYTSLEAADSGVTVGEYESVDLYEIEATVAGDPNEGGDVSAEEGDEGEGNQSSTKIGDEKLYVGLLGWTLNATARHSNISKEISAWTNAEDGDLGFTWNVSDYHRSYWGKSFNYGIEGAESAYNKRTEKNNTDSDETSETAWLNDYLKYTSLSGDLNTINATDDEDPAVAYCAENTNNTTVITSKYSSAITGVLVKAIVCQKKEVDGTTTYVPADLVRYHGELYEQYQFLDYVLAELTATGKLNAYYVSSGSIEGGDAVYTHIGADYVELSNVSDGKVEVVFKETGTTLYSLVTEDGVTKATEITDFSDINDALSDFCEGSNYDAVGYKGGLMYYNIPIEHLRDISDGDDVILEANYGVVRNHLYKITISKLENIGKGIFNPDEVIVPNPKDEEKYYYVGADIEILSWHVVDQIVTL